ncbi:Hypothetical predicted protein [Olea europaea subsp. europaea]|uniref:DUF632 domain-containing protein n=1 Tax=Olea europaea subsp. europaea TaxID=158383 RepID=A0A8S0SI97_OLEEU|nr:Hypothetical predicted protein [Olea europaea subsp. europaea]
MPNKIEKLRDNELVPQVNELLQGMKKTWKIMLESHEIQKKIIQEVKYFTCPLYGKFCNESHRRATLQLETELLNWRACFTEYITAHIKAVHGWLAQFVAPEVEIYSRGRCSTPCCYSNGPPPPVICRDWLASKDKSPDKVSFALKSCRWRLELCGCRKERNRSRNRKGKSTIFPENWTERFWHSKRLRVTGSSSNSLTTIQSKRLSIGMKILKRRRLCWTISEKGWTK